MDLVCQLEITRYL